MKYSLHVSHGARNDFHMCPMVTPGVPPIPHVGGPILPPCEIAVLTGGLPQARVTDMALSVGPPDMIVMGSMSASLAACRQPALWTPRCTAA